MKKADLIDAVSKITCTKKEAREAVETMLESITKAMKKEKVTLAGFGTFSVKKRASRTGRNPRSGETLKIPARKVPVFRPGKALREAVK